LARGTRGSPSSFRAKMKNSMQKKCFNFFAFYLDMAYYSPYENEYYNDYQSEIRAVCPARHSL
jgi:hypothetical protein